jgi:hypothetical protein
MNAYNCSCRQSLLISLDVHKLVYIGIDQMILRSFFRDLLIPRVIHLFWFMGSILLLRILIYYY